jgi:hypothetical protein
MSLLGDALRRSGRAGQEPGDAGRPPAAEAADGVERRADSPAGRPEQAGEELRRRRDVLAEQVTELHWDLGGLAYEMAIRDHFRLDVLVRRAALLQERDAELAEVERLLRLEESASAGSCPACGAPHSRGAVFCWQCGATLMDRAASASLSSGVAHQDSTAAIDALLVGDGSDRDLDAPAAPSAEV